VRVVYSPAAGDRGADLVRVVGACRACREPNVVWLVRGHVVTLSLLPCEHCGSTDVVNKKKRQRAGDIGIAWSPGTDCWNARVMGKNYPERAQAKDLVR
jgi:hypothetical protein